MASTRPSIRRKKGTKAAAVYRLNVNPGECRSDSAYDSATAQTATPFGSEFQNVLAARHKEADHSTKGVIPLS